MQCVYPPHKHQTFESSTFVVGSVPPDADLTINDESIPVSSKGFFSWKVALTPGENRIQLLASKNGEKIGAQDIEVMRIPPLNILTTQDAQAPDAMAEAFPAISMTFSAGEALPLFCLGPTGAKVVGNIEGAEEIIPVVLTEQTEYLQPQTGIFAQRHMTQREWGNLSCYRGAWVSPVTFTHNNPLKIQYVLQKAETASTVKTLGEIVIKPYGSHQSARVQTHNAVVRTTPETGARLTPLLEGTILIIDAVHGEWQRFHYAGNQSAWIHQTDIMACEQQQRVLNTLPLIETQITTTGFEIRLPLTQLHPIDIQLHPQRIQLKLEGIVSACDFIHDAPEIHQQGLTEILWVQDTTDSIIVTLHLNSPLIGFAHHYDSKTQTWIGSIKTLCARPKDKPYTIVLDPGHGGEETGSTAPDGTLEKDLNLKIAQQLKAKLEASKHCHVILTRNIDTMVTLSDRVRIAQEAEADLLLSLHHNALPDGRDPLKEHGVSTFYYMPFSLPVAKVLQEALVNNTQFEDYGLLYDSLYLCRVTEMPALLLELGFFTHPEDAERCLDPMHQAQVIHALTKAIARLQPQTI